jgi:hypothetical protein
MIWLLYLRLQDEKRSNLLKITKRKKNDAGNHPSIAVMITGSTPACPPQPERRRRETKMNL